MFTSELIRAKMRGSISNRVDIDRPKSDFSSFEIRGTLPDCSALFATVPLGRLQESPSDGFI